MSFLSKKKPKYHQMDLGLRIGPPTEERSSWGLLYLWLWVKWKTSVLEYSIDSPTLLRIREIML